MAVQTRPRLETSAGRERRGHRRLPPQLAIGIVLVSVSWPLAWFGPRPYSTATFFPLWLGYILTVDGIVRIRSGTSLLTRSARRFVLLFLYSAPFWWLFEGANVFLANWHYEVPYRYGPIAYVLLSSLSFSTVIPAVCETASFYRSFRFFDREICWLRIAPPRRGLAAISIVAAALAVVALAFPRYGFAYAWLGLFFVLDPINALLGQHSIAGAVARRRWDTVLVLFAAGLTCGFFWEMWNYYSMPKWTYAVPFVGGFKVFEMPILGYGGYLPFALEVYAIYQFLHWLTFSRPDRYLGFDQAPDTLGPGPARD